ncbi:MAG: DAK2 domain-containing protein, partial [Clostridiales bacterium]|nr:DAK2 domain-containing protein [Clostridiales bacterium]
GDSVVVVDDDEIIKVHCHTDNPGSALQEGLKFGALTSMKIENMREQHEERVKEVKMQKEQELPPAEAEKQFGFVAVAAGAGIERLYSDLGVDHVVQGGQTMNPSTEDILKAVNATPSEIVFVLPNNKNIIMAAEQAVDLAHKKMCVLQTRTIPQGIAAMLAFDENADFNRNRLDMTKAIDNVSTGQVTFAARDSDYDGHEIKKGEILALDNGKLSFTERDVTRATYRLARKLVKNDSSFVTLIYGADVDEDAANVTAEMIQNKLGHNIDVTVINGGQPVYYYIVSVE